jgi:hypothetical protein
MEASWNRCWRALFRRLRRRACSANVEESSKRTRWDRAAHAERRNRLCVSDGLPQRDSCLGPILPASPFRRPGV